MDKYTDIAPTTFDGSDVGFRTATTRSFGTLAPRFDPAGYLKLPDIQGESAS